MATATPLDNFLRNLLVDHHKGGERRTTLVVDNAASSLRGAGPLRYTFLQAGSLPASSNHSHNRWSSGEGSPKRETMKTIPTTTTAESSPTVLTDAPIKNGNSLPTFPVRNLSPQVHHRALTSERCSLPPSVVQLYYERSPQWSSTSAVEKHKQQKEQSIRPPLSPRKNATGQEQNGGVSINKIAPLQSPLRSHSSSNKSVSLQWSPSLGHRSIKKFIFPAPSVWIGDQHQYDDGPLFLKNDDSSLKDDMPPPASQRPTRGLSATLGTDLPMPLPPVAPVRQVSAQIYDVQEEDETLSFYDSFLDEDDDESRLQGILEDE